MTDRLGSAANRRSSVPRWVAAASGASALLVGGLTLLGYALNVRRLTDWNGSGISMFPNAAACAALSGIALLLLATTGANKSWRNVVRVAAGIVGFAGGLTLLENLADVNFGIDTLLFQRDWGQRAATAPMRMGPPASTSYLIIGTALLLALSGPRARRLASTLASVVVGIASLSLVGYWFGADHLFGVARFTGIAFQTSLVLTVIGIGLIAAIPEWGMAAVLQRDDPGGVIVRRLLLPIIMIPLVLGWLRVLGQEAGYFDTAFGTALLSLLLIGMFVALLWWTAAGVSRQARLTRAAQATVRQNEELLRTTLASIGDAVITTDTAGRVSYLNTIAETLTGWTAGEAVGQPLGAVFRVVDERTRLEAPNPVAKVLAEGTIVRLANHTTLIARDGSERPIDDSTAPIRDAQGQVIGCVLVFRDETERRRVEQQLAIDKARIESVVNHVIDGIITIDERGVVQSFNPAAERLFGYAASEVIGRKVNRLMPDPYHSEHDNYLANYLRTGTAKIIGIGREVVGLRQDGSTFPMELGVSEYWVGDCRHFTGIVRDITQRKQAEEILREQAELLDLAHDAIIVRSTAGVIASWNRGAELMYGWPKAAVQGKSTHALLRTEFPIPLPDIETALAERGWWEGTLTHTRHDGDRIVVASRWTLHAVERGNAAVVLEINSDMTAQIRAEEAARAERKERERERDERAAEVAIALRKRTEEVRRAEKAEQLLREADRRKDEFLATLAHELRNPLAPLRHSLELLRRADLDQPLIEQTRNIMERQVAQMVRLVDDLLDVSRITQGKLLLREERVELAEVLKTAVETSRPVIDASAHELTVTIPAEPIPLQADPTRLAQVFANLLNNAAKYTEPAGHIGLTAERQGAAAVVSVRDTGIGIAAEHLSDIFSMFSQVAPALERSQGGLGIGLSLVKGIVDLHGGEIEARSAGPGTGSEFVVRLPIVTVPCEPMQESSGGDGSRSADRC